MKSVFAVLFAVLDLSIIQDVAEVLQQGGVNVPTDGKQLLKTLLGLLVWAVLEYNRRKNSAKVARAEVHKVITQREAQQDPAAAPAGAASEPVSDLATDSPSVENNVSI